eukprot:8601706-Ditylum_brightwellii.AAC.1
MQQEVEEGDRALREQIENDHHHFEGIVARLRPVQQIREAAANVRRTHTTPKEEGKEEEEEQYVTSLLEQVCCHCNKPLRREIERRNNTWARREAKTRIIERERQQQQTNTGNINSPPSDNETSVETNHGGSIMQHKIPVVEGVNDGDEDKGEEEMDDERSEISYNDYMRKIKDEAFETKMFRCEICKERWFNIKSGTMQ